MKQKSLKKRLSGLQKFALGKLIEEGFELDWVMESEEGELFCQFKWYNESTGKHLFSVTVVKSEQKEAVITYLRDLYSNEFANRTFPDCLAEYPYPENFV